MIYFDNAATSWTLKEAEEAFIKENETFFGNPSSNHGFGREASNHLEGARNEILDVLGLNKTHSLVFTSGATESNNLAIKGVAFKYQNRGKKIITSAVEHPSVSNVFKELIPFEFEPVFLPVNEKGQVEPKTLAEALDDKTVLVSIMAVNNEVGSINDIAALADLVHQHPKAFFHVDATQAMGKIALPYAKADLISFSAHKFGGLKGTGGLVYKKSISFEPVNMGGEQEKGIRGGTVNMPGFVAMAKALSLDYASLDANKEHVAELWHYLYDSFAKRQDISINSPADGLPYVLNISLKKKKASVVLEALSEKGIYVSSVSACSSKGEPISTVLEAMGKSKEDAMNSIRLSFSPRNTLEEAKTFESEFYQILEEVKDR
jgi:cysteine desulfurase